MSRIGQVAIHGGYVDMDRLTVAEAAARLGVKEQAVRKRIQRDTIRHDKDEDGRVYVYIDPYEDTDTDAIALRRDTGMHTLVDSLQDQISFLRSELERKDTIIMSLTQRIPELEPAPEPREGPFEGHDSAGQGDDSPEPQAATQSSWWRRFFGL
jgi:hypothetical protein